MTWVLRAYDRQSEELVREDVLAGIDAATLRRWFSCPDDDPMVYVYPVTPPIADVVRQYVDESLHLDQQDYFIEPAGD